MTFIYLFKVLERVTERVTDRVHAIIFIKIMVIVHGDVQRVGHGQSPQSFWRCRYLVLLLNYKNDE